MNREDAQGWLAEVLMDKVRRDRFPSPTQLSMIEEVIPRSMLPDYLELLIEKAEQDAMPSIPMLRRIKAVSDALPSNGAVSGALPSNGGEDDEDYDEEE